VGALIFSIEWRFLIFLVFEHLFVHFGASRNTVWWRYSDRALQPHKRCSSRVDPLKNVSLSLTTGRTPGATWPSASGMCPGVKMLDWISSNCREVNFICWKMTLIGDIEGATRGNSPWKLAFWLWRTKNDTQFWVHSMVVILGEWTFNRQKP